jgi:AcrR family transcriptional regulator
MSYIAQRRQEEKDRRRAEIVDAAEELYREVVWDAVTMDGVAKSARLSRALVYVYFKDKRDLHLAIAVRALETMQSRFTDASDRAKLGLEKIDAIGRAYLAFGLEFPHYFDACARLEAQAPQVPDDAKLDPQEQQCVVIGKRVHDTVVEALVAGQKDGTVRSDMGDLQVTSRVLWGFTHGMIQIAMTKDKALARAGISVPEFGQQAIDMIRYMLAAPKG